MKLFVLTPIYATTTTSQGATPVVHYFTREWVKMGHEVTVFHLGHKFPRLFYSISKRFQHQLNTRLGMLVPINYPKDTEYEADGVRVFKRSIKKIKPHSRYSKKQIEYALNVICKECERNGVPDWFIGHWDNPQLEILFALRKKFNKPSCLVLHSNKFDFEGLYGGEAGTLLSQMDVIGFRNLAAQQDFVNKYGEPKKSFIAYSGVSDVFLNAGASYEKTITMPVRNFVFVGSLINRKYPTEIITALSRTYPNGDFNMTYIGDGADKEKIELEYKRLGSKGSIRFTGRIPRDEIVDYLRRADVFVMISKGEIFGLVYLEAMAMGVIPIGSRNEGIDGIIRDGENGFLCEAGSTDDLAKVLNEIKNMSLERLSLLSNKAKSTAQEYSDKGVAEKYLNALL